MFRNLQRFQAKPIFLASSPLSRSFSSSLICNAKKTVKKSVKPVASASLKKSQQAAPAEKAKSSAVELKSSSNKSSGDDSKRKILTTTFNMQQYVNEVQQLSHSGQRIVAFAKARIRNLQHPQELAELEKEKDQLTSIIESVATYLQDKNLLKIQMRTERASDLPFNELTQVLFQINAMKVHDYIAAQLFYLQSLAADFEYSSLIWYQKMLESQVDLVSTKKKAEADPRKKVAIAKEAEKIKKALEDLKEEKKATLENLVQQQRQIIDLEAQLISQKNDIIQSIKDEISTEVEEGDVEAQIEALSLLQKIALVEFDAYDPCSQFGIDVIEHKHMLAFNLLAAGEHEESAKLFEQVIEVPIPEGPADSKAVLKAKMRRTMSLINCGSAYLLMKRLGEAVDRVNKGLMLAQESGFKSLEAQAMRIIPAIEKLKKQAEGGSLVEEEVEVKTEPKTAAERAAVNRKLFTHLAESAANSKELLNAANTKLPDVPKDIKKLEKKIIKKAAKKSVKKE